MNLLAIDVGFAATGWVVAAIKGNGDYVIINSGTVITEPPKGKTSVRVADCDIERAAMIYRGILCVVERDKIAGIAIELPSGGAQGARANRAMGIATGIAAAIVAASKLPCEYVTPNAVKMALVGNRAASKDQMMKAATERHTYYAWPSTKRLLEHQSDAVGVVEAIKHGQLYRMLQAMEANR